MQQSRIIILSVAAGVALLVMLLLRPTSSSESATQAALPESETVQLERVLVSARDLSIGDYIERKDLTWIELLPEKVPENAITEAKRPRAINEFNGWVLNAPLGKGDQVVESMLIDTRGAGFIATRLAPGMRAVSVAIKSSQAAGGFIVPSDRVDVVLVKKTSQNRRGGDGVPRAILENVRVVAIDQVYARNSKGSRGENAAHHINGSTATLEVTPRDADVLAVAGDLGAIHLTLRGLKDITAPQGATSFGLSLLPDMSRVPLYTREGKSEVLQVGEYR